MFKGFAVFVLTSMFINNVCINYHHFLENESSDASRKEMVPPAVITITDKSSSDKSDKTITLSSDETGAKVQHFEFV